MNEYSFTEGLRAKDDTHISLRDGWHFSGVAKMMESVIFMNMLCNDWKENLK